ncbi:MAG: (2Fe-2S)-binding protein [Oligoflexia bacterium]|nr:(2Fe-2S)-binding protein [Oligoflexia bacterium]
MKFKFKLNKKQVSVDVAPMSRLLDVLRNELKLTGSKEGCGEGECGACSVIIDGEVVNSCLIPICQTEGAQITTIEGLAKGSVISPLQKAFTQWGGAQCGICTPGMLMAAQVLLHEKKGKVPTDFEMREALAGNLCRCTGYTKIFLSIKKAALALKKSKGRGI